MTLVADLESPALHGHCHCALHIAAPGQATCFTRTATGRALAGRGGSCFCFEFLPKQRRRPKKECEGQFLTRGITGAKRVTR